MYLDYFENNDGGLVYCGDVYDLYAKVFKRIGGCSVMEVYEVSRQYFYMSTTIFQRSLSVILGHLGNQMTQWNKVWS
jgi:hypothetical protein